MRLFVPVLLAALQISAMAADAIIRFAGAPAELKISEVSERAVRFELFPLDDQSRPRPAIPFTVLVPFPTTEKLRVRELFGDKELRVGQLRLVVKSNPLSVSVRPT